MLTRKGPRRAHITYVQGQNQLRRSRLPPQHCCLHAATSSGCRGHFCSGHKALQHTSTVRRLLKATCETTKFHSALAPLHGLDYISPSLVALAARKIYPHRIIITAPENERSMQWGSSLEAVKIVLKDVTVEGVVEDVLESVEVPL